MKYQDSHLVPNYMDMLKLEGRGIVVLGAGDGMGRQACHALAQAGARVLCVDRDPALGESVSREVGGVAIAADVTLRDDVKRVFDLAERTFGTTLAGVVDIVGFSHIGPLEQIDDDAWAHQFDVVLRHAYLAIQIGGAALARRGGGSMVFIGSLSGVQSVANQAAYGTAKAALHHLVRCAAHELGPNAVRVNAIAPGFVRTPRLLTKLPADFWDRAASVNPMGRIAIPADIAGVILFLCSDLAGYVTGNILTLDGGASVVSTLPRVDISRGKDPNLTSRRSKGVGQVPS